MVELTFGLATLAMIWTGFARATLPAPCRGRWMRWFPPLRYLPLAARRPCNNGARQIGQLRRYCTVFPTPTDPTFVGETAMLWAKAAFASAAASSECVSILFSRA